MGLVDEREPIHLSGCVVIAEMGQHISHGGFVCEQNYEDRCKEQQSISNTRKFMTVVKVFTIIQ